MVYLLFICLFLICFYLFFNNIIITNLFLMQVKKVCYNYFDSSINKKPRTIYSNNDHVWVNVNICMQPTNLDEIRRLRSIKASVAVVTLNMAGLTTLKHYDQCVYNLPVEVLLRVSSCVNETKVVVNNVIEQRLLNPFSLWHL